MVELLNPGFTDIRPVFETEFDGMTLIEVTCEDEKGQRRTDCHDCGKPNNRGKTIHP